MARRRETETEETEAEGGRRGRRQPIPAGAIGPRPVVAVVGRPNVGKSTLFNRLVGARIAIVEDVAGVTRDRHYADADIRGRNVVMVDTGGLDPESDDPMKEGIARHVGLALGEADVVLAVLDASAPPTPADRAAAQLLRRSGKPVVWALNKADSKTRALEGNEHYELGMDHLYPVSSLHGHGMGALEDAIARVLPPEEAMSGPAIDLSIPRVAIIGRPNAGKSSLVNRLLQEDRQLVDARPGTTVDSVDALYERGDDRFVLIDTAGIRRKRGIEETVEAIAVMKAIRAIERADAVVLLIDAAEGASEQDARLLGLAVDRGRAVVIGLNKADLLDDAARKKATTKARETFDFANWAQVVPLSAKTGRAVPRVLAEVTSALKEREKRVPTAELNRFFEEVLEHHPPPTQRGRAVRIYYVTQAETRPPRFVVVTNEPESVHFSYQRYVINALRERFGFRGTPVRASYRRKNKKEQKGH